MVVVTPLMCAETTTTKELVCTLIACLSVMAMFTTSALFHRVTWSPKARRRMRKADHSAIFVCIAGTYTAVAGLALSPKDATVVLSIVWAGAIAGIVMRFAWMDAPKWVVALPYVLVGWVAVGALPPLFHSLGVVGFAMLLAGGLLYTAGAVCYALKRPDPWPTVFGYHEIFHACVVLAAACHLALIAFVILPAASS